MTQYIHILESTGTICLKTIETDVITPTREAVLSLLNQQATKMADDNYRIKVTSSPKCTDHSPEAKPFDATKANGTWL